MTVSNTRTMRGLCLLLLALAAACAVSAPRFHGAPDEAVRAANPYAGQAAAIAAGRELYAADCATCHGRRAEGGGNVPALAGGPAQRAADGELFWFVTRGDAASGMPAWNALSEQQRWQIVSFVKTFDGASPVAAVGTSVAEVWQAPPPPMPFTDFRYEAPGRQRRIGVADLPPPFATESARNGPSVVPRPPDAWPRVPEGFEVQLYAEGLRQPRLLRTAPNGDVFVAESAAGQVRVFRGIGADGKAQQTAVFADGLQRPFGIAFYPPGPDPQWVYVGDTDAVLRYPYHSGDLQARGEPQHLAELPHGSGHWTRDLQFSRDGRTLFVAVGSGSNVDDPDTTPAEQLRADILAFTPEGMDRRVYASGIRNPVGLAVNPQTGELWCSVNERDGLGDNLVPDYITHVREGGFYGWPWWYIGAHQDPRHAGKHPELKDRTIVPDVLLQPHSASLEMTFYDGRQLPPEYRGEVFAAEHGSWNKSTRAGYEVIRVPLHGSGHASGEYQDFLTGFVLPSGEVWGRPVGVTVAADGSLLVSDDGSNSIWRVSYKAK